ncbi:MAG: 4-hydroxy-tetrahydrodipicolinate synthase [Candidatus Methanospirareceae archaeon]
MEGVYPAIITPFTKDDEIDKEGLRRIVEYTEEGGVAGIVPCGTTGESATLSHEEHKRVIDIVVECARVPVIAGTGSNSTREALELTKYAEDAGADACLLITPYYNKPNTRGLKEHFKKIASSVDIPIVLYNVPSRTGLNMAAEVVAELAKEENIRGIKEASGNIKQIAKIIELTAGLNFAVISGDDFMTVPIMSLGGKGVISVAANVVPREVCEMVEAMLKKDYDKAMELHYKLFPLFEALFLETNPIPVKKAMEMIGLPAGHLRPPLGEMSKDNEEKLRKVLEDLGLLG